MELCLGGDLFDRVSQRGRLSEESASKMCRSLVEALLHCHLSGIMHRDIKPENILLCDRACDYDIKLVDFGVATFFDPGERIKEVLGTPEYMAPEVLLQSYGPEADIWSAGVVLYIALCGVPPFWAASRRSVVAAILEKDVSFKSTKWAGISDDCKDLVARMLTKDPHRRITALEILGECCNLQPARRRKKVCRWASRVLCLMTRELSDELTLKNLPAHQGSTQRDLCT